MKWKIIQPCLKPPTIHYQTTSSWHLAGAEELGLKKRDSLNKPWDQEYSPETCKICGSFGDVP